MKMEPYQLAATLVEFVVPVEDAVHCARRAVVDLLVEQA